MSLCADCMGIGWIKTGLHVIRCSACARKASDASRRKTVEEAFPNFMTASLVNWRGKTAIQKGIHERISMDPDKGYFIYGPYRRGKTHLLVAQFKASNYKAECLLRTSAELIQELETARVDREFISPVLMAIERKTLHLFWDDMDKIHFTKSQFRAEVLFELIDEISRKKLKISGTSNRDLNKMQAECGLPPATARRLSDMCDVVGLD